MQLSKIIQLNPQHIRTVTINITMMYIHTYPCTKYTHTCIHTGIEYMYIHMQVYSRGLGKDGTFSP